jgi:Zn-finger nucleic acid-binding protein
MTPTTLHCPSCGAAVSSDSTQCQYCKARLETVACPSCFGLAFVGSKFCPHCGKPLSATHDVTTDLNCPRCHTVKMLSTQLKDSHILECPQCAGLWLSTATFSEICNDNEQQQAALQIDTGLPNQAAAPHFTLDQNVKYLACPQCSQLMNRLNFAHRSGVIIDICNKDGIWFDRDSLRHIIEFIRAGGLVHAHEIDAEELVDKARTLDSLEYRLSPNSVFHQVQQRELANILSITTGMLTQFLPRR